MKTLVKCLANIIVVEPHEIAILLPFWSTKKKNGDFIWFNLVAHCSSDFNSLYLGSHSSSDHCFLYINHWFKNPF